MSADRFKAAQAGREWRTPRDLTLLAKLCEGSGLSGIQAEVVRLSFSRHDAEQISMAIGRSVQDARYLAGRAEARLKRSQSWIYGALARDLREVLSCLKNTFNPNPRVSVFRKIAGGYDSDPVRFRSRLFGEAVEDLIHEEGRLLRTLPHLLKSRCEGAEAG